jgi:MerR family transcriptional regulator, mercuric resistance operon regulatory protein
VKHGWYGANCVKFPIQAPLTPKPKRTSGKIQQDEAANAPSKPPAAINTGPNEPAPGSSSLIVMRRKVHPIVTIGARVFVMRGITTLRAADGLTIGALSKLTGVNVVTIRYYEQIEMLPLPPRTAGGRRVYDASHVRILAFIRRSRELGFSLDEIRALIRLGGPERASCRQVRAIATHHLNDIRTKIADLRKLERLLAKTIAQCTGTTAPVCAVLDILDVRRTVPAMA